jgi:hypothetical protein
MLNEKFFEDNDEFAYVIGLLLTDGCVRITQTSKGWHGYMSISLKESDRYLLEKVRDYLDPDRKIYTIHRISGFEGEDLAKLDIVDKDFLIRIMSYGVVPKKTKIVSLPNIPGYEDALIRGIFDGDGSVWTFNQGKNFGFGLRSCFTGGCRNFMVQIGKLLQNRIGIIPKIYEVGCGNDNWRLAYGSRESIALYDFMYKDNISLYHIGKRKIFKDWLIYKGIEDYKAKCSNCGNEFVRLRRERNWCNDCYKARKHKNKLQSDLSSDVKLT